MESLIKAIVSLNNWINSEDYFGWDPFDAMNSSLLKNIIGRNRFLGQVAVQLLKRSPINVRNLIGVKKGYNSKAMGLFLYANCRSAQNNLTPELLKEIDFFSKWLQENSSRNYSGACWGYNFDWPNRNFFAPAGTPTIVNSGLIGMAFTRAHELIEKNNILSYQAPSLANGNGLKVARSVCDFILKDLDIHQFDSDKFSFSYTPLDKRYVHNANLVGAMLLSEVYKFTNEAILAKKALAAANYSASCQLVDGSWWYGENTNDHWIDNFHTGFVLVALKHIATNLNTTKFDKTIQRGYQFWNENFILPDGTPKYYSNQTYPIDIHCVSQSILTFLDFSEIDPEAFDKAVLVTNWAIKNMQNKEGYFDYQITRFYKNKIPYMRWGQAWMLLALTELQSHQRRRGLDGIQ
jgi:hypothetical protein